MIVMAAIAALTSFFSFLLVYMVYRKSQGKEPGRIFLHMSMLLGIWAFIAVLAYSSTDLRRFILLFRISFVFQEALPLPGSPLPDNGVVFLLRIFCLAPLHWLAG